MYMHTRVEQRKFKIFFLDTVKILSEKTKKFSTSSVYTYICTYIVIHTMIYQLLISSKIEFWQIKNNQILSKIQLFYKRCHFVNF